MVTLDEAGRYPVALHSPSRSHPLADFVEHAWVHGSTGRRRIVPDASPHIVVAVFASGRVRARLVGPRRRYIEAAGGRVATIGVRLRPGAVHRLLGIRAKDLVDGSCALEDILPGTAQLEDRAAAGDPEDALRILLSWLTARAQGAGSRDWRIRGVEGLALGRGARDLAGAARDLGMADRTLRHVVGAAVGLPLALWRRIARLHDAAEIGTRRVRFPSRRLSISRIAQLAGYYDHSHLVRDFQALLGETPSEFFARRGPAPAQGGCRFVQDTTARPA